MTELIDTWATLARRRKRVPSRIHDCGRHGKLTVREICKIAGVSREAIYSRFHKGWRGELLCAPRFPSHAGGLPRYNSMTLAMRIGLAAARNNKLLSIAAIQQIRPMSRVAATRWRVALRVAMEQAA